MTTTAAWGSLTAADDIAAQQRRLQLLLPQARSAATITSASYLAWLCRRLFKMGDSSSNSIVCNMYRVRAA